MMYYTFHEMVMIHFLLGVGIAIIAEVVASRLDKPRFLFVWAENPLSKRVWQKWYIFAYALEVLTSLFWFSSGMMYVELAYSIWQAALMVIGAFLVDRAIVIFNAEPETKSTSKTFVKGMDAIRVVRDTWAAKPAPTQETVIILPDKTKEETQKFDDLIRGH